MSLEELTNKLLFNNVPDIWFAICTDQNSSWNDFHNFKKFAEYIKYNNIKIERLGVCPSGNDEKSEFIKKISILFGDPTKTFVMKTDAKTIELLQKFQI
mgnify:CR=1 FL=1